MRPDPHVFGVPGGVRTHDLEFKRLLLYLTELPAHYSIKGKISRESNPNFTL
jgi:predicted SprT family Zn-dependent metalloprotease